MKFEKPCHTVHVAFLLINTGRINEQKAVGLLRGNKRRGLVQIVHLVKPRKGKRKKCD